MKVLYLLSSGAIGGGNRSLLTLWTGLEPAGVAAAAFLPAEGPMADVCRGRRIEVRVGSYQGPSWRDPVKTVLATHRWRTLIAQLRPDLIHANDLWGARAVTLAAASAGIPLVCHIRFPPGVDDARWAFRGLPKPAAFLFTSRHIHEQIGAEFTRACPRSTQEVVHNAVDLSVFTPVARAAARPLRVGIVANLSPIKRHVDFFTMARLLRDRGHRCEFWVVGDDISGGGCRRDLEREVDDRGLRGDVTFLGFRPDVHRVFPELDVVVSTSEYESFGRTLIEAMAMELPVVATRVGGVPEIVEDGVNGFLVPALDPAACADAVERLLLDRDARTAMGRAGRARTESLFTADAHARRVRQVYEAVTKRSIAMTPRDLRAPA